MIARDVRAARVAVCSVVALAWLLITGDALAAPSARPVRADVPSETHADLDGDGRPDVVTASCSTDCGIDVVLSRRAGILRLETGGPIRGVIAADVDRDGDADLVTLGRDGVLVIWTNEGDGRFSRQQPRAPAASWFAASGAVEPDRAPCADLALDSRTADACVIGGEGPSGPSELAAFLLPSRSAVGPTSSCCARPARAPPAAFLIAVP